MKRSVIALLILGLLPAIPSAASRTEDVSTAKAAGEKVIVLDVACDARTFRLNRGGTLLDALRGDSFIVNGKVYPGGTIEPGGTPDAPGPFDPDTAPGSIGNWVCRGTFLNDINDIFTGAEPHVFTTQFHLLDDGRAIVSDGPEGSNEALVRAVTGGMGDWSGAAGEMIEETLGINVTGLGNFRYTIRIKKKSIK